MEGPGKPEFSYHCRVPWAPGWEELGLREASAIEGVVVHRIEVSQEDPDYGDDPEEVIRFFREHPIGVKATGGGIPYPILIAPDGTVTQILPLTRVSPHAVSHNPTTVGVALVGDFRTQPVPPAQYDSLVWVLGALLRELGLSPDSIAGHDELAGASRDPDKECPGRHLPVANLRVDVAEHAAATVIPLRIS